uniref:Uncharacterized protein n=1 Tax=Setaria italica TaxID=4555 RepID=K3XUM1_SETIT
MNFINPMVKPFILDSPLSVTWEKKKREFLTLCRCLIFQIL